MIYILLSNEKENEHIFDYQLKIIKFLRKSLSTLHKSNYKIIFCPKHIIENKLSNIKQEDYLLWHPNVAANNLSIVKRYTNSFVILRYKTVMLQKISERNPIDENMALNNNFGLIYIDENHNDITNDEWRLIVNPKIFKIEKIVETLNNNIINNIKSIL